MREIKFRAYHLEAEKMVPWESLRSLRYSIENKNIVVMQYTNLKDKNGVDIYEGDIIQYKQILFNTKSENYPIYKKEVKWDMDRWNIYSSNAGELDIEVIGNIFGFK